MITTGKKNIQEAENKCFLHTKMIFHALLYTIKTPSSYICDKTCKQNIEVNMLR